MQHSLARNIISSSLCSHFASSCLTFVRGGILQRANEDGELSGAYCESLIVELKKTHSEDGVAINYSSEGIINGIRK